MFRRHCVCLTHTNKWIWALGIIVCSKKFSNVIKLFYVCGAKKLKTEVN